MPVTSALGSRVQPRAPPNPLTPRPPGHRTPHSPGLSPPSKHLDHVLKNHVGKRKNRPKICFHPQNTADPSVRGFHTTNQLSGPLDANDLPRALTPQVRGSGPQDSALHPTSPGPPVLPTNQLAASQGSTTPSLGLIIC